MGAVIDVSTLSRIRRASASFRDGSQVPILLIISWNSFISARLMTTLPGPRTPASARRAHPLELPLPELSATPARLNRPLARTDDPLARPLGKALSLELELRGNP